jgi:hypothetical protein
MWYLWRTSEWRGWKWIAHGTWVCLAQGECATHFGWNGKKHCENENELRGGWMSLKILKACLLSLIHNSLDHQVIIILMYRSFLNLCGRYCRSVRFCTYASWYNCLL